MNPSIAMERIANSVSMVPIKGYALDPQDPDFVDFLPNTDPFEVEHECGLVPEITQDLTELLLEKFPDAGHQMVEAAVQHGLRHAVSLVCVNAEEDVADGQQAGLVIPVAQFTKFGLRKFQELLLRFNLVYGYCDDLGSDRAQEVTHG